MKSTLSSLNFNWDYLKNNVYKTKPENHEETRRRIFNEDVKIPRESIYNSTIAHYNFTPLCQQVEGYDFELVLLPVNILYLLFYVLYLLLYLLLLFCLSYLFFITTFQYTDLTVTKFMKILL